MKILICDDEEKYINDLNAHVHEYMCNRFINHEIITATSAHQIMQEDTRFDLAFLDVQMDGPNGIELAKELQRRNSKVAIFFVTNYDEYQDDAMDIRAFRFFSKPFDVARLYSGLDKAMEYIDGAYVDIFLYLTALLDQLVSYTKNCHSGNMMLDVMVDKYSMDCERMGIRFDYYVKSCNLKDVADIDLVAVLGNLLDNALAAAGHSEEKTVSLETTIRNGYYVVIISNSCDVPPNAHEGKLLTTKADKKIHGFGLKSVSRTLKKYNGDFRWDYDTMSRTFIVTAMIAPHS